MSERMREPIASQWLILGIALFVLGGATALNLALEYERTAQREQDRLLTQAKVIQVNGGKNLMAVNQVLVQLAKDLPPTGPDPVLNRRLDMLVDAMPSMRTLLILDANGTVRASNRPELIGISVAHRAYFKEPLRRQDIETFYVSPPFRTVLGTFTINVTRMIRGPRGEFAGVVSAALDPAYFRPLLDSVRYAQDMWATLVHGDGEVFMMVPERLGISGKNVAQPDTFFSRHRASGRVETVHSGIAYITGDARLLVWSSIEPAGLKMNVPLAIGVARSLDDIFAAWHRDVVIQGSLFGLVALTSIIGLYAYRRRQRESERRMAADAAALAQSAERLELATAAAGVGVWDYDVITGMLTWDDSMFAIYGAERAAFSSSYAAWRGAVLPEDLPSAEANFKAAIEQSTPFEAEFRIRRGGDGAVRDIRALGRSHHDDAGKSVRVVGTNEDITERKAAEATLEAARRTAEEANLAKSRFLATMSHEIRTPLNGILGMAQLLMTSEPTTEERRQYVRTILESGKLLLTLLNDILDLSKVEAGKFELIDDAFAPNQLLDEIGALFADIAGHKGLSLEVEWRGAANRRYHGDPIRLRQMLSNFVANALKFTSHGGIRVSAEEVAAEDGATFLRFAVSDTGIGVPVEKQHLLFKPFSQIDASNTREFGGTGLGLSIVSSLAKLMGGDVGVDSGASRGATFWFRVRAVAITEGEECRSAERGAIFAAPAAAARFGRARILIVEDVATNRVVVEAMLKKLGHDFFTVADGAAALQAVTRGDAFGLVLMDCQMPVMDGFEATQGIRAWEAEQAKPRLPIVALTAGAFHEDHDRCIAAGMDGYLAKPVDLRKLAATIDKWLVRPAA